jgi:hypothetical protein
VVGDTLGGALAALRWEVEELADAAERQRAAAIALRTTVDVGYRTALSTVESAVTGGALLRGEVLLRWRQFVDQGELRTVQRIRAGRLRERMGAALGGQAAPGSPLQAALSASLVTLLAETAAEAADRVRAAWATEPAGGSLLATLDPMDAPGERMRALARDWRAEVDALADAGTGRVRAATALLVMLGVLGGDLASGVTRDDPGLRTLVAAARAALLKRVRAGFDAEAARFCVVLADADTGVERADALRRSLSAGAPG